MCACVYMSVYERESAVHVCVYVHVMRAILNNLICRRHFHAHLHMSVLQDNCHAAPTLCGHHGIYSDLKFVCVYKSKCIHEFMCKCAHECMKSHVNSCVIMWCVFD